MPDTFQNRLRLALKESNMKQAELSRRAKVNKSSLTAWLNGDYEAKQDNVYKLAKALSVSEGWLMGMSDSKTVLPSNTTPIRATVRIPVLGKIACGDPITAEENIEEYRTVPKEYLPNGELFFLEAIGDSMEPKIPNGSYVMCRRQEDVESGEIAAVLLNGDEDTTLKKVIKQGQTILLQALNESYSPYIITEDNPARIVGKAIRVEVEL